MLLLIDFDLFGQYDIFITYADTLIEHLVFHSENFLLGLFTFQ